MATAIDAVVEGPGGHFRRSGGGGREAAGRVGWVVRSGAPAFAVADRLDSLLD